MPYSICFATKTGARPTPREGGGEGGGGKRPPPGRAPENAAARRHPPPTAHPANKGETPPRRARAEPPTGEGGRGGAGRAGRGGGKSGGTEAATGPKPEPGSGGTDNSPLPSEPPEDTNNSDIIGPRGYHRQTNPWRPPIIPTLLALGGIISQIQ